jgi:predicted RNA-binding Zn ribbon-like protein
MTVSSNVTELQEAGFPMGGEPLVALDLIDTLMTAVEPPVDLLEDEEQARRWWELEAVRLPAGPRPAGGAVRRLRAALRDLFDAQVEGRESRAESVADVNAFAAAVPTSHQLVATPAGLRAQTRWHTEHGGDAILASIAREAIALLADPARREKLRRCANPTCSMLFLAENKRRVWCSSAGCGNRARAARHYRKTHGHEAGESR